VTVTKGTPVVDVKKNSGLTYTGNALRLLRVGATTGGKLVFAVVKKGEAAPKDKDYSVAMPTARDAGVYTVYYRVEGDEDYNDVAAKSVDVTIKARTLTIYVADKEKTYGEADPILTFTQTGLCAGDRLVGALEREAGEDAGTYTISRGSLDLAKDYRGNYTLRVIPGILTVGKAAITITADDKFGPAPATIKGLELTWKVSGDLTDAKKVQRKLNVELALGDERDTLPVTYPIAVRFTPNGNYTVAVHDGTYTVSEDDLEVSVEGNNGEYDGTEHPFVVTIEGEHDGAVSVIFSLAPLNDIPEDVSARSAYFELHSGGTASPEGCGRAAGVLLHIDGVRARHRRQQAPGHHPEDGRAELDERPVHLRREGASARRRGRRADRGRQLRSDGRRQADGGGRVHRDGDPVEQRQLRPAGG